MRAVLAALALVLGAVGIVEAAASTSSARALGSDSIAAPSSARPPVDGITPSTTPRVGDLATNGRSRARWSGEVLAVLALALAWGGPAVGAATRRRRSSARVTAPQRPALGRAPPAFG